MEKVYSRTRGGRLRQIDGRMVQFIKEKQKLWKELKNIGTGSKGNYLAMKKRQNIHFIQQHVTKRTSLVKSTFADDPHFLTLNVTEKAD